MDKYVLSDEAREGLKSNFKRLKEPVTVAVFTAEGQNDQFNDMATKLITEVTGLDERLTAEFYAIGSEAARKHGVERSPSILIAPDRYAIRFTGTPLGEEGSTFVMALLQASTGTSSLSSASSDALKGLNEKRDVRVFFSPT